MRRQPLRRRHVGSRGWTLHFAICVPARDEGEHLPSLFAALNGIVHDAGDRVTLCLLLDGCSDASLNVAKACGSGFAHDLQIEQVGGGACNAGRARGLALAMGMRTLADGGLLLTTDADSAPARDWLVTMRNALDAADLVAGAVRRIGDSACPLHDRLSAYLDDLFSFRREMDPVAWEATRTHHHASGANMGLRPSTLRALGGVMPLASGEDARLVDDASRAGLKVRRDAACVVSTSDRRSGRATAGYGYTLDWLDRATAAEVIVAHPHDAAWQYGRQALARAAFDCERLDALAASLAMTSDRVRGVARDCPNAEAFAMRVVPAPPGGVREVPLPEAEAALAALSARPATA